ncbi:MAG: hypothetical protein IE909_00065 [Campylobacterales bacterium]|nr:hypothetical protein [Campylobacterales bacterium]
MLLIPINLFLLFLFSASLLCAQQSLEGIDPKKIYIQYNQYPKRVFTNQQFDILLKGVILEDEETFDSIVTDFSDYENIQVLTTKPQWIKKEENIYETKIAFKVFQEQFTMPRITVALKNGENITHFKTIEPLQIKFEKIAISEDIFCNVIAKELQLVSAKTKQYTNNLLITTLHLEGQNSNLENFYLNKFAEQGLKDIQKNYPQQSIFYYVIVPIHMDQIVFEYYNTLLNDFVKLEIPVQVEEELVSTQTDLNPYNSSILLYKQIAIALCLVTTLVLFAIKRKNIYLVFASVFILILAYYFIPNKKIILQKGTMVYILPSKNSTVFKITQKQEIAEIINQKDEFIKVIFENQNIGWIKQ